MTEHRSLIDCRNPSPYIENHRLRAIIIRLQDYLSNDDRKRFVFFLGNLVPRITRDDSTLSGTLTVMDALFDQDIIRDDDFTFLINTFDEIQCFQAANLLRNYKQQMQYRATHESTHSLKDIMSCFVNDLLEDQNDSIHVRATPSVKGEDHFDELDKRIPLTTTGSEHSGIERSLLDKRHRSLPPFRTKLYFWTASVLLTGSIILVAISITVYNRTSESARGTEAKDSIGVNAAKMACHCSNDSLFVSGRQFGTSNSARFDDSKSDGFTPLHYLHGIFARDNDDGLESYQFYYTSPLSDQPSIESDTHGTQTEHFQKKFDFPKGERIIRVVGRLIYKSIVSANGTNTTMSIITGIQFFSDKGRASPSSASQLGEVFSDERPGYTLGYATGRAGQYVEQVQFFWYRTSLTESNER